jgi:acyl carrier protein
MDSTQILNLICERLRDASAAKGSTNVQVNADTAILEGSLPVDSLDLAAIVVELESATGRDPFREGFINFRTVGDLVRLYCGAE